MYTNIKKTSILMHNWNKKQKPHGLNILFTKINSEKGTEIYFSILPHFQVDVSEFEGGG